ncbi:MAG TPA: tetratricopeptide repeat protein [Candidatus Polarisedimenticolaceae bacterium]|nr:tetratricopeptide repeat protein [Candidatus Polarisedimenticolaceae bacterium]
MPARRPPTIGIAVALAIGTFVCFLPVLDNGFIDVFDDGKYVTENPDVKHGLDAKSLRWAFTTTTASNWHPLTWISHIVDTSISGMQPRGHHLSSVILHALSTALLFMGLARMTGQAGRSVAAAALFGVHPLRLESVAWVAERKDVLSGFFFMIVLWLYARYAVDPRPRRMAAVAAALALGLMAKPMLVTAPFVLLLLDAWPLGRMKTETWRRLVLEKAPLFALSIASCALTVWAQRAHAVRSLQEFPLTIRVENAIVAYAAYLGKTVWPAHLAVLYPHPGAGLETWKVVVALLVVGGISYAAYAYRRSKAWLPVGWLWYAGMLVPVIGLVQVGQAGMADRYTYLPSIGLALMLCWSVPATAATAVAAGAATLALAAATWHQAGYWKDSITLFTRAIEVTRENGIAHSNLGLALYQKGDLEGAIHHDEEAIRLLPRFQPPRGNLGVALADAGRIDEAIETYRRAIELDPSDADAYNNLGTTYYRTRNLDDAIMAFREAIRCKPDHANATYNLGTALAAKGDYPSAASILRDAVRLDPGNPSPHANLASVLIAMGDIAGAWREVDAMRALGREPSASLLQKLGPR